MGKKIKCPICSMDDFTTIEKNGATVLICSICGSCYRAETKSWFHLAERERDYGKRK